SVLGTAPFYLAIKEFPASIFPDFEATFRAEDSILDAYAAVGINSYLRAETRILGDFANEREAGLLQISIGAPLIRARSYNRDLLGRVIEFSRGCWPMFSVELVFGTMPGPGR